MRPCPKCGGQIKDDVTLCKFCHQPVPVADPAGPADAPAIDPARAWYCDHCGFVGYQKKYTPGSFGVEVLAWLLMILPGILYSLWRLSARYWGCPKCATGNMMPASSPKARAAIEKR